MAAAHSLANRLPRVTTTAFSVETWINLVKGRHCIFDFRTISLALNI